MKIFEELRFPHLWLKEDYFYVNINISLFFFNSHSEVQKPHYSINLFLLFLCFVVSVREDISAKSEIWYSVNENY